MFSNSFLSQKTYYLCILSGSLAYKLSLWSRETNGFCCLCCSLLNSCPCKHPAKSKQQSLDEQTAKYSYRRKLHPLHCFDTKLQAELRLGSSRSLIKLNMRATAMVIFCHSLMLRVLVTRNKALRNEGRQANKTILIY